jgi:hypothetical protein
MIEAMAVFMGPSRQIPGLCLKLSHNRFLSHPFQFIIQNSRGYSDENLDWKTDR